MLQDRSKSSVWRRKPRSIRLSRFVLAGFLRSGPKLPNRKRT